MSNALRHVYIYTDFPSQALSIEGIIDFLHKFGLKNIIYGGNIIEYLNLKSDERLELARSISSFIVKDINHPNDTLQAVDNLEAELELKRLEGKISYLGNLYDGFWLQRILYKVMSEKLNQDVSIGVLHLILTSRLFGTFDKKRYHARVILLGLPSLISTSGIVEAPARPKEYYWLKAGFIQGGKDITQLDEIYKGMFVEYDDSRLTSILGAYVLQAVSYEITGKAFCEDPSCCLYNSHWQEEVLRAQLEGKLCEEHRDIFPRFDEM